MWVHHYWFMQQGWRDRVVGWGNSTHSPFDFTRSWLLANWEENGSEFQSGMWYFVELGIGQNLRGRVWRGHGYVSESPNHVYNIPIIRIFLLAFLNYILVNFQMFYSSPMWGHVFPRWLNVLRRWDIGESLRREWILGKWIWNKMKE